MDLQPLALCSMARLPLRIRPQSFVTVLTAFRMSGQATNKEFDFLFNYFYGVINTGCHNKLHQDQLWVWQHNGWQSVDIDTANDQFLAVLTPTDNFFRLADIELHALIGLLMPKNGIMLDIGANWGEYSLAAALQPNFTGQVQAFEPDPRNFKDLVKLVSDLGLQTQIICHPQAVGQTTGEIAFEQVMARGRSKIAESADSILVPIIRLDDLSWSQLDLMKIDVEEAEHFVLSGATETIAKHRPYIIFENYFNADLTAKQFVQPIELLLQSGYQLFGLTACQFDQEKIEVQEGMILGGQIKGLFPPMADYAERIALGESFNNILAIPTEKLSQARKLLNA